MAAGSVTGVPGAARCPPHPPAVGMLACRLAWCAVALAGPLPPGVATCPTCPSAHGCLSQHLGEKAGPLIQVQLGPAFQRSRRGPVLAAQQEALRAPRSSLRRFIAPTASSVKSERLYHQHPNALRGVHSDESQQQQHQQQQCYFLLQGVRLETAGAGSGPWTRRSLTKPQQLAGLWGPARPLNGTI